jgi:molybdenum cofactor biosynthesis protein B
MARRGLSGFVSVGSTDHDLGRGIRARVALLTVSDTRVAEDDRSGALARRMVEAEGHQVADYRVVPDEPDRIRRVVREWLDADDCDAVVVNGGSGISARDRTIEAIEELVERKLDGFGELFRMLSFEQVGSRALLSRAFGGVARSKPLFAIPGSPKAVELALERLILPELGHLLAELRR